MEWIANIVVPMLFALIGIIWGICIDRPKRWSFLGYIPTVIAVLYEIKDGKIFVVLTKNTKNNEWILPQGRVQREGLVHSLEYALAREVGIQPNYYKMGFFEILGILPFKKERPENQHSNRISNIDPYSLFSLFSPRGKGYLYTLCACRDIQNLQPMFDAHKCYEVEKSQVFPIEEAENYLLSRETPKVEFYKTILSDLRNHLKSGN